jgi:hypothetical protein
MQHSRVNNQTPHQIAIFNCGAKRLLHKNMVGFGVVENIKQDLCMCHVGGGYHDYITQPTVQQRSMICKHLQAASAMTNTSPTIKETS